MTVSTLLVTSPDSDLGARIAQCSTEKPLQLSLDAAFTEDAITIATALGNDAATGAVTHVRWQGHTLIDEAGARFERILIERPLFSWPQPWCDRVPPLNTEEAALEVERLHAARSLTISALRILEDKALVANRPSLALFAAIPAIALARLQRAGIPVHAWTCGSSSAGSVQELEAAPVSSQQRAIPMQAPTLLGAERWVTAAAREAGSTAILVGIDAGPLEEVLVVGGEVVAGGRDNTTAKQALDAAKALDLVFAAITVDQSTGRVAWVDAAPDLDSWDRISSGKVAQALSSWLFSSRSSVAAPHVH